MPTEISGLIIYRLLLRTINLYLTKVTLHTLDRMKFNIFEKSRSYLKYDK